MFFYLYCILDLCLFFLDCRGVCYLYHQQDSKVFYGAVALEEIILFTYLSCKIYTKLNNHQQTIKGLKGDQSEDGVLGQTSKK